jgi:hypothetical protein
MKRDKTISASSQKLVNNSPLKAFLIWLLCVSQKVAGDSTELHKFFEAKEWLILNVVLVKVITKNYHFFSFG